MSKYHVIYGPIIENILNNEEDVYETHEYDLPHGKEIQEYMCYEWNNANMHQYFNDILKDKIESTTMRKLTKTTDTGNKEYFVDIEVTGIPKFRFSERIRNAIADQVDAQLCDGWGESIFNIPKDNIIPGTTISIE